jgi:hypothetical protein
MADHTIIAAFDDYSGALSAIREMETGEDAVIRVSLVANNAGDRYGTFPQAQGRRGAESGAFLAEIGAVVLPGIGPVVAAGPVAATLGRGIGLVGALVALGVPREPAELYAEAVRRGATLVAVRAGSEDRDRLSGILERYRPMNLDQRVAEWQHEGWRHFDERIAPHPGPYYGSDITLSGASADHGISPGHLPESERPGGWTIRQEGPVGADWNKPFVRIYPAIEEIPDDSQA